MPASWGMLVGGARTPSVSGDTYQRFSPATGDLVGSFAKGDGRDVETAVEAARRALPDWSSSTGAERAAVLRRLAEILRGRAEDYARWESRQVGIPYGQVSWLNWYCADVVDFFAGAARMRFGRSMETSPSGLGLTLEEPVGVVGVITPWNFPLVLTIWKVAAALAAGCTVVVKPASHTPITVLEMASDLLEAGLPPGACNVVTGPGSAVGAALVEHPDVDKIAFTGETATGKEIMAKASGTLKRVSLELGGKSPLIVMPDADLDAATGAALECFFNSGQQCNVPSRVLAAAEIADQMRERVVAGAEAMRLGSEDDADLGPLVDATQCSRVEGYVSEALANEARLLTGGSVPEGLTDRPFFPPTVLDRVDPDARVVREEVFGPVMVIQEFDHLDDAVRLANAGDFGLAAGIFTADLDSALVAAKRLRAGTVWINVWNKTYPELPTGGMKMSGLGRELGLEGLSAYLETKTVQVNPGRSGT